MGFAQKGLRLKKYRVKTSVKKGVMAAVAVAVGIVAAVEIIGDVEHIEAVAPVVLVSAVLGGFRAGLNWWKHRNERD